MSSRQTAPRPPVLLSCLGAVVTSLLCCGVLVGLAVAPALDRGVPPPPAPNPTDPDITIVVEEAYLDRTLTRVLPTHLSEGASLDLQGDNRMVVSTSLDLLVQLDLAITLKMVARDGEISITLESIEAGGQDILDLLDIDREALGRQMSQVVQGQVEAALDEGAQIVGLEMDANRVIITARWMP